MGGLPFTAPHRQGRLMRRPPPQVPARASAFSPEGLPLFFFVRGSFPSPIFGCNNGIVEIKFKNTPRFEIQFLVVFLSISLVGWPKSHPKTHRKMAGPFVHHHRAIEANRGAKVELLETLVVRSTFSWRQGRPGFAAGDIQPLGTCPDFMELQSIRPNQPADQKLKKFSSPSSLGSFLNFWCFEHHPFGALRTTDKKYLQCNDQLSLHSQWARKMRANWGGSFYGGLTGLTIMLIKLFSCTQVWFVHWNIVDNFWPLQVIIAIVGKYHLDVFSGQRYMVILIIIFTDMTPGDHFTKNIKKHMILIIHYNIYYKYPFQNLAGLAWKEEEKIRNQEWTITTILCGYVRWSMKTLWSREISKLAVFFCTGFKPTKSVRFNHSHHNPHGFKQQGNDDQPTHPTGQGPHPSLKVTVFAGSTRSNWGQ